MFSADSPFPNPNLLPGFVKDIFDFDRVLGQCQDAVMLHKLMRWDSLPNSASHSQGKTQESSGLAIF